MTFLKRLPNKVYNAGMLTLAFGGIAAMAYLSSETPVPEPIGLPETSSIFIPITYPQISEKQYLRALIDDFVPAATYVRHCKTRSVELTVADHLPGFDPQELGYVVSYKQDGKTLATATEPFLAHYPAAQSGVVLPYMRPGMAASAQSKAAKAATAGADAFCATGQLPKPDQYAYTFK